MKDYSNLAQSWKSQYLSRVMAPVFLNEGICGTLNNVSINLRNSSCSGETRQYREEDRHALLYIVCTLLFYSLGIMIGIVSYIKREKRDIEQDRMFNDFLNSFKDKAGDKHYRQIQVQETIERLAEMDRKNSKEANNSFTGDHDQNKNSEKQSRLKKFVSLQVIKPVQILKKLTTDIDSDNINKSKDTFVEVS